MPELTKLSSESFQSQFKSSIWEEVTLIKMKWRLKPGKCRLSLSLAVLLSFSVFCSIYAGEQGQDSLPSPDYSFESPDQAYYDETGEYAEETQEVLQEEIQAEDSGEYHTASYYEEPQTNQIEGWPAGPLVEGSSAILMDLDTDAILYAKNIDVKSYPASITKLLTGLIACENLDPSSSFAMSETAAYGIEPGSSSIYGDVDEVFTVEQALMGLMLESANEMGMALAEQTSGSVKKFVELMNQRARELTCTNSHFNNPHGLPDEGHYTTARDMSKIAKAAWQNRSFRTYFTTDYYEIPPTNVMKETRYLLNHHKMMPGRDYAYDGVQGGKTGYTNDAGNTLVTFAKRGNLSLVCVVLGSINGAYSDTAAILDYGFGNFEHLNMKVASQPAMPSLGAEQYLLKDGGSLYSFWYRTRVTVTVPKGTKRSALTRKQSTLENSAGPLRIKSKYYFNGQMTGWGMQYEEKILDGLVLSTDPETPPE